MEVLDIKPTKKLTGQSKLSKKQTLQDDYQEIIHTEKELNC